MNRIDKNIGKQALEFILNAKNIIIIPHNNPDGDAVGSALALKLLFNMIGKNSEVIAPSDFPESLKWMPEANNVILYNRNKNKAVKAIKLADLIFYVDFNAINRIEKMAKEFTDIKANTILIDHHPDAKKFTDILISDTNSSSTSELIFEFIESIGKIDIIDKDIANCILTGIFTDTGILNYNSSNPQTFNIVSKLLDIGAEKNRIIDSVYNNFSSNRMKFMGYCLNNKMKVFPEFGAAYISITKEELTQFEYQPGDIEGFVNLPLSIKGIVFTGIFVEKSGFTKVSFRSEGNYPANSIAKRHYNGGGHLNAAGGKYFGTLEESIAKFEEIIAENKCLLKK